MIPEHLKHLVCPIDGSELCLENAEYADGRIQSGELVSAREGNTYPIADFIPRFVPNENYAKNFGFQWKSHAETQIDRFTNTSVSRDRFFQESRWESKLHGAIVLEAGCGAGRFTEHAISTGATVVSFDYSNAVEVNYQHNGDHRNLLLIQADIYNMPFARYYFDRVFCFGVIQHTPDVHGAFVALTNQVKRGGKLVFDVYVRHEGLFGSIKQMLKTKYWARRFTVGMDTEVLYGLTRRYVNAMWPIAKFVSRFPLVGPNLVRFILIADNGRTYQLTDEQRRAWAVLDTFDWLSPAYDSPQRLSTVRAWLDESTLCETEADRGFNGIEARGVGNH